MSPTLLDLAASLAGSALVLGVPGPTNALLAAAGGARRRDGAALVAAVVVGYGVSVSVLRFVGTPILAAMPELGAVLRLFLSGWLLWLGCCLWRRPPEARGSGIGPADVCLATLLNPKGAVFAFALWPAEASAGGTALAAWSIGLAATIVIVSTLWLTVGRLVATIAPRGAQLVARLGAVLLFGFAATLCGTAVAALV